MTLHEAIKQVLINNNNQPLSSTEIAGQIALKNLYFRKDGQFVLANQVMSRVHNYSQLFEIENGLIRIKESFENKNKLFESVVAEVVDITIDESINLKLTAIPLMFFIKRIFDADSREYLIVLSNEEKIKYSGLRELLSFRKGLDFKYNLLTLLDEVCKRNTDLQDIIKYFQGIINDHSSYLFFNIFLILDRYSFDSETFSKIEFGFFFNQLIDTLSNSIAHGYRNSTPRHINKLISNLYSVTDKVIMDPFAGTAGTLISCKQNKPAEILGYEKSRESWLLGTMNLIINGVKDLSFSNTDCLTATGLFKKEVDLIITDLPFNSTLSQNEFNQIEWAVSKNATATYIQYILDNLKNDGKAVAVVPQALLFGSGKGAKIIKEMIIDNNWLDAVITLPAGVFLPYTSISCALLCIDLNKKEKTSCYFIDASEATVDKQYRNQRPINDDYIDEIIALFKSRKEVFDSPFKIRGANVDINEIKNQRFDITPKRYLNKFSEEIQLELYYGNNSNKIISLKDVIRQKKLLTHSAQLLKNFKAVKIADLKNSIIDYTLSSNEIKIEEKISGKFEIINDNSLLISTRFNSLKPTYFRFENEEIFIANGIKAFSLDEEIISVEYLISQFYEPYFLKQLDSIRKGTAQQFFSTYEFMQLKIKLPNLEQQADSYKTAKEIFLMRKAEESEILMEDLRKQKSVAESEQVNIISSIQHELGNKLPALKNTINDLRTFFNYYSLKNSSFTADIKIRDLLPGEELVEVDSIKDILERSEKILNYTISMVDDAGGIINSDPSRFRPQKTNLLELIGMEVNTFKKVHKDYQNINFVTPTDDEVFMQLDRKQMAVAINNIIQNAFRHGFREKNRIYNMVFQLIPDDDYVILVIKNDGQPFPPDFTIEKYKQPYQFAGETGNSGFGGFIVNRVVENHGGALSFGREVDIADNFKVQFELKFSKVFHL